MPSCWACHSQFEPLAYGFDRFDAAGRYVGAVDQQGRALPIDGWMTDDLSLDEAARPRYADVAELMAAHARVTVITAHPNYPAGKFYPGTRWWRPVRSEENGVTVWRLPMVPDQSTSVLRRALSYLSFLVALTVWAPFVAGRPSVVWVYQTPFTTAVGNSSIGTLAKYTTVSPRIVLRNKETLK